ncbi:hypothetical protein [Chryseobacterium pennipullorum]|uniref:Uncharacterized protein n=1 Tax=Chryseobacterium pennipullorum TaxID=2258963 RepID=A0A3D9AYX2_9FLAO|nr:hypothetical protein [Chryseobacterium pennipullorum]REC46409.1 hypothetical protein DRF67_14105 [Chryseobacterium pennipullorum]
MKKISILLLLFISILGFGQDGQMWRFDFEFSIKSEGKNSYQYQDLDAFVNETSKYLVGSELKYNPVSKKYNVLLTYTCIGCGKENRYQPPELYLKLNMKDVTPSDPEKFSVFIPVYFSALSLEEDTQKKNNTFHIGEINIDRFLSKTSDTYEVIEMLSPYAKKHSVKGEYIPRKMTRMVSISSCGNSRK